jgi:hypothetical protein
LKVVAFFLGVLPQAIKLFSMRGIVGTQMCAAMFLAASVTRPISCKSSSHFAASIDLLKESDIYTIPLLLLLLLVTMIAHYVVYIWLYFKIAAGLLNNAGEAASDRSVIILFEIALLAKTLYVFSGLLTIIFNLIWRRSLRLSKWLPLIVAAFLPDRNTSTRQTESGAWIETPPPWIKNLSGAFSLIALGLLGCLQVSALCIASGRVLSRLAARRAEHSEGFSDASLPTMSPDADGPGSTSRFHVADAFWQGIG